MNEYLRHLTQLTQAARDFWQAWQAQLTTLRTLDDKSFVQESNAILEKYLGDIGVEIEGEAQAQNSTLIFTAHGIRENLTKVQAIVATAPKDMPYQVVGFRRMLDEAAENFAIGMEDFHLSLSEIWVRLGVWQEMPALEIAFDKPIEETMLPHAHNMTFILMDHLLGEWNAAVKIGTVDFVDKQDEDFFPLIQLPEKLNLLWQTLGRDGQYPSGECQYASAEIEENAEHEQDALVLTRNQSANALLGRADMGWIVSICCEIQSREDFDVIYQLEDALSAYATQHQQGIDTLFATNLTQGQRTAYFATAEPELLLTHALSLCEQYAFLGAQAHCEFDPNWAHYRL